MNRTQRHILSLVLALILLAIPTIVLAKELGLLTISGPGIKGEVTLNNPDDMMNLEQSGFFDQAKSVKPPEKLGEGYNITAHLNLDGKMVPVIQMVYYPAEEGQQGYVHYTGRLNGESLQTVDQWAVMRPQAETALRNLMTAHSITIQPAILTAPAVAAPVIEPAKSDKQTTLQPASAPSVSAGPAQAHYLGAVLVASILILLGAGFVLRRRAINQRSV